MVGRPDGLVEKKHLWEGMQLVHWVVGISRWRADKWAVAGQQWSYHTLGRQGERL